jgi:hypothetical protein
MTTSNVARGAPPTLTLLALAACAAGDPGDYAVHLGDGRFLDRPVLAAWFDARDTYRDLRIPVGSEDRESWTLESADLRFGAEADRYVICQEDPSRLRPPGTRPVGRLKTVLTPENGTTRVSLRLSAWVAETDPSGEFRRRECASRGVLEDEVFRALRRRGS